MTVDSDTIRLYRCEVLKAWISLEQCETNFEREAGSRVWIDGMLSCRDCPGLRELPDVETKEIEALTRPIPFPAKKRKKVSGRLSHRSQLAQAVKARQARLNGEE